MEKTYTLVVEKVSFEEHTVKAPSLAAAEAAIRQKIGAEDHKNRVYCKHFTQIFKK